MCWFIIVSENKVRRKMYLRHLSEEVKRTPMTIVIRQLMKIPAPRVTPKKIMKLKECRVF